MPSIIYVLIGSIVGYLIASRFLKGKMTARQKEAAVAREKVMKLFRNKDEITNDDVQNLLGVSHSTATRYMDELEKEGRVRQIGRVGHNVTYKRN